MLLPIRISEKLQFTIPRIFQTPVVKKMENAIHWINPYPVDNVMGFRNTYSQLDSNLSGGEHYPAFEQLRPEGKPNAVL